MRDNENVRITLPKIYTFAGANKSTAHQRRKWLAHLADDLKNQIKEIQTQLDMVQLWLDEYETKVCRTCKGSGTISWVGPIQDESHSKTCSNCKGTGEWQYKEHSINGLFRASEGEIAR